jgi:hypothetical protein
MSTLRVDEISARTGSGTITIPSGNLLYAPGHVIQTQSFTLTSVFSAASTTAQDTGVTVNITPTTNTSKILVLVNCPFSINGHGGLLLVRNGTIIAQGDASSNRARAMVWSYGTTSYNTTYDMHPGSMSFLDSPTTTSTLTYKVQTFTPHSAYSIFLGWQVSNGDATWSGRTISNITVMEIAG